MIKILLTGRAATEDCFEKHLQVIKILLSKNLLEMRLICNGKAVLNWLFEAMTESGLSRLLLRNTFTKHH